MKKILILSCGGTITMKKIKGVLSPYYDGSILLKKVPELSQIADFRVENITNLDSTNISVEIWTRLADTIKLNYQKYDGFIVTHGTDTMVYTASAMSYAMRNLNKPIIFTGSQKPLDDLISDGRNNLLNAGLVALTGIPEICIVFGPKILKGNRSTKMSESSLDAFDSPMIQPLGEISLEPKLAAYNTNKQEEKELEVIAKYNPKIIVITLHPGLPIIFLKKILKTGCNGIILNAFGAGNIPANLHPFLREAQKLEIPVVVLSQCSKGITQMQLYSVGFQVLEAGAIPGHDMTLEAAATKLMWALGITNKLEQIKKMFNADLAGEVTL